MKYKLLSSKRGGGSKCFSKMISITKTAFTFSCAFRDKYGMQPFISFYVDEDGFLCFKLFKEKKEGSFKISKGKANDSYHLRRPKILTVQEGRYDVKVRDHYFVTDCKLNVGKNEAQGLGK